MDHAPIVYDISSYKEETNHWGQDPSAYLLRYYTKYYFLAKGAKGIDPTGAVDSSKDHISEQTIIDQQTGLEILRGDQFVYQSPNKLCITGLAPTHPLIAQRDRFEVLSLHFDPKIYSTLPQPTAIPANSKKQSPPSCHAETVILKIEARDRHWDKSSSDNIACLPQVASELAESEQSQNTTHSTSKPAQKKSPRVSVDPSRVIFVIRGALSGHVMELNERLLVRDPASNTSPTITDRTIIDTMLDKALTHGFIAVIRPKIDKTEIALKDLYSLEEYEHL
ncbi:hypothetical protein BGW38_010667 [Lunasporangiospora selenospora]|uniref:Uncharacterized protein n=1 Tax=Lunasporangiospora selenospora TaxID=979761 RepID=A0A9P6G4D4_9FUNG|nr:hypothetical protein BGW38_010667 [Lunasporangiospora selenospora]